MHIHILGICGTFMGSLAIIAKGLGLKVSGCDTNIYPPMSDQLKEHSISVYEDYEVSHLKSKNPDLFVIGNAISRSNPLLEYILNCKLPYISGPQFLYERVLINKWVLAITGTHGKTTTTSMLSWILNESGYNPGFLIGGVAKNFGSSARLTDSSFFVIEADEYDTAFFDKRSKFIHYCPDTLVINNMEFDHADIFKDLSDIQDQFHHLIRILPSHARIIYPNHEDNITQVLKKGVWSELETISVKNNFGNWAMRLIKRDGSQFQVFLNAKLIGSVVWQHQGMHNVINALSAIASARHVGVLPQHACYALNSFLGVKRRMELIYDENDIKIYDDFAHHPTAIESTIKGLRDQINDEGLKVIIEIGSNTMKMGCHKNKLLNATKMADQVIWYSHQKKKWIDEILKKSKSHVMYNIHNIVNFFLQNIQKQDRWIIMSNSDFGGLHQKLINSLKDKMD